MKHIIAMALSSLFVLFLALPVLCGPTELSESQLTDMTVVDPDSFDNGEEDKESTTPPQTDKHAADLIRNPVDNPSEITKHEVFRLENQAADQRVTDQLQNTTQGIKTPE